MTWSFGARTAVGRVAVSEAGNVRTVCSEPRTLCCEAWTHCVVGGVLIASFQGITTVCGGSVGHGKELGAVAPILEVSSAKERKRT